MPAQRTPARRSGRARTRYLTSALSPGTLSVPWRNLPAFPLLLLSPAPTPYPSAEAGTPKWRRPGEGRGLGLPRGRWRGRHQPSPSPHKSGWNNPLPELRTGILGCKCGGRETAAGRGWGVGGLKGWAGGCPAANKAAFIELFDESAPEHH